MEEGLLIQVDGSENEYKSISPLKEMDIGSLINRGKEAFEDIPAVFEYIHESAENLLPLIKNEKTPLEILFPGGSLAIAEELYQKWSWASYFNQILKVV